MRSLDDARRGWDQIGHHKTIAELRDALRSDETVLENRLRSVYWKCFLLFQNLDRTTWPDRLKESRAAYSSLRNHFMHDIDHPDDVQSDVDPLSETNESPWDALRKDESLRAEIFKDVERCMPDNAYYRQPIVQKMSLDILFIYCKLNPDIGYRQGMHELLAPIIWVVDTDSLNPQSTVASEDDRLMMQMLDKEHIEADAFTLFALVMQSAKPLYEMGGPPSTMSSKNHAGPDHIAPILIRCQRVTDQLLVVADPDLAKTLSKHDIAPQLYLMRWLRLLFGREFEFEDTLLLWDRLFAEDPSLELADYICVVLLLRIHWQVVEGNAQEALTLLMHYPPSDLNHQTQSIVNDAVKLRKNLSFKTGRDIVREHTGRLLPEVRQDPEKESFLASPVARLSRLPSPFNSPAGGSLETLLQDAARGVIGRTEQWGIQRAVRDVVGEMKRNVQNLQAPSPRSPFRYTGSPQPRGVQRSATPDLLKIEIRNKHLADILDSAVQSLWVHHELVTETPTKELQKSSTDALAAAIAQVQLVQACLKDASMPLPEPSVQKQGGTDDSSNQSIIVGSKTNAKAPSTPPPAPRTPSPKRRHQPIATPYTDTTQTTQPSTPPPRKPLSTKPTPNISLPPAATPPSTSRPPISQSSFSFMLGQVVHDTPFTTSSPFEPGEKRASVHRKDKAFLFGEEDEPIVLKPRDGEGGASGV